MTDIYRKRRQRKHLSSAASALLPILLVFGAFLFYASFVYSGEGGSGDYENCSNTTDDDSDTYIDWNDIECLRAPGAPDMTAGTDSGSSSVDNITADSSPDFLVSCDGSLNSVYLTVRLYVGGTENSNVQCDGSAATFSGISFVSDGEYSITARQNGGAQEPSTQSELSGALSVTIDTTAPDGINVTQDLQAASDSGYSSTDNVTSDNTPTFDINCESGNNVELMVSGSAVGSGTCSGGTVAITSSSQGDGSPVFSSRETDVAGNGPIASNGSIAVTIDTSSWGGGDPDTAPDMTAGTDSGSSSEDNITSNTNPTFTGTCSSGYVYLYYDGTFSNAVACSGGSYSVTADTLAASSHSMTTKFGNAAGSLSNASPALAIAIDTTAPATTGTPDMTAGTDLGSSSTDNLTSDNTPDFSITCETDATVTLYVDGVSGSTGVCSNSPVIITSATLSGTPSITAKQTDVAGNTSASFSSGLSVTIDTTAPTITSVSSDKDAGSYTVGEVIDIDVAFSEAATSTGNVTVTLETGTTDRTCTFTMSGGTTGTCNYTVQSGDTSSDLDATISGTIADTAGNAMSNYTPTTGLAAIEALVINTAVAGGGGSGGSSSSGTATTYYGDSGESTAPIATSSPSSSSDNVEAPIISNNDIPNNPPPLGLIEEPEPPSILDYLIPSFLKPEPKEEPKPKPPLVPALPQLSLQGEWNLISNNVLENFVLGPLPSEIVDLTLKFPKLGEVFASLGIANIADLDKLQDVTINLPKVADSANPPAEVVFAKTGEGQIDVSSSLNVGEDGIVEQKIHTLGGKSVTLQIKPDGAAKSVKGYLTFKQKKEAAIMGVPTNSLVASALVSLGALAEARAGEFATEEKELLIFSFEYTDPDGDGIYTADIQTPLAEGEYEVITIISYTDQKLGTKELRMVTVIDPEGYIYEKDAYGRETRIKDAKVSIFRVAPSGEELWDAQKYSQDNPQTTDKTGKYAFLVPEGSYYLQVESSGHNAYKGGAFAVKEGNPVHENIELVRKNSWLYNLLDWKMAIILIILAIYITHLLERRRKLI